jgi:hypothetical protein
LLLVVYGSSMWGRLRDDPRQKGGQRDHGGRCHTARDMLRRDDGTLSSSLLHDFGPMPPRRTSAVCR